jgi:hypothetical protein
VLLILLSLRKDMSGCKTSIVLEDIKKRVTEAAAQKHYKNI